jgi:CMP-N-acetylneuraminic acid synthetase
MSAPAVYAVVPARGGSKGVLRKNLRPLGGHPLVAWAIAAGLQAARVERVVVSTEDDEIAEVARRYGADVPFLRPPELANDTATDLDFLTHAFRWFRDAEGRTPDLIVELRPTTPLRDPALVDEAVAAILGDPRATSLRSVHELPEPPQKMMGISAEAYLEGLFPHDPRPEYYNLPRQAFPPAYHPNGYVDVVRSSVVLDEGVVHGARPLGFVTPRVVEVDAVDDLELLEWQLERREQPLRAALDS